jgi:hypothetical protein
MHYLLLSSLIINENEWILAPPSLSSLPQLSPPPPSAWAAGCWPCGAGDGGAAFTRCVEGGTSGSSVCFGRRRSTWRRGFRRLAVRWCGGAAVGSATAGLAGRLVALALPRSGPDLGWGWPLAPSSTLVPLVAATLWWRWLATAAHNRPVAVWRRALCRASSGMACSCCDVWSTTARSGGEGCSLPRGCVAAIPDLALALSASRPHVGDL